MRTAVPNIQELFSPLHDVPENMYSVSGKRTSPAATKVLLFKVCWTEDHVVVYDRCKSALANQFKFEHRDDSKRLCLFTDACGDILSGIITQVPIEDLDLPFEQQRRRPMGTLSRIFNATQGGWSTFKKEAYVIISSCHRMHWLRGNPAEFNLYTDYKNLISIFDPTRYLPDLFASSVRTVLCWDVTLSWFNYTCYHISGTENIWADLIRR